MNVTPPHPAPTPQGLRPQWPPDCFPHLEYLGKRCIAHNPADRPTFGEIVKELEDMEVMLRELLQVRRGRGGLQMPAQTDPNPIHKSEGGPRRGEGGEGKGACLSQL